MFCIFSIYRQTMNWKFMSLTKKYQMFYIHSSFSFLLLFLLRSKTTLMGNLWVNWFFIGVVVIKADTYFVGTLNDFVFYCIRFFFSIYNFLFPFWGSAVYFKCGCKTIILHGEVGGFQVIEKNVQVIASRSIFIVVLEMTLNESKC